MSDPWPRSNFDGIFVFLSSFLLMAFTHVVGLIAAVTPGVLPLSAVRRACHEPDPANVEGPGEDGLDRSAQLA